MFWCILFIKCAQKIDVSYIQKFNEEIYPVLEDIINTQTFTYIYIDLSRDCKDEELLKLCSIEGCRKDSSLDEMLVIREDNKIFDCRESKQCDKEHKNITRCMFVSVPKQFTKANLKEVVQEYTGYIAGSSRIWKKLEDAFKPYDCFVSGMHFSVTTHAAKNFTKIQDEYLSNWKHYTEAYSDEYRDNFYCLFNMVAAAIKRVKIETLKCLFLNENDKLTEKINKLMILMAQYTPGYQGNLSAYQDDTFIKADIITDCIECGTCKLWGKIQIYGVATALKILSGQQIESKDMINLLHLFWKLCETVEFIVGFEKSKDMLKHIN